MNFEWDENKNASNLQKHRITFEDAAKIFLGRRIEKTSDRGDEKRFIAIGEVNSRIIAVIYTLRVTTQTCKLSIGLAPSKI